MFKPRDLPEIRSDLVTSFHNPELLDLYLKEAVAGTSTPAHWKGRAKYFMNRAYTGIRDGRLFYASPEMSELTYTAATSLVDFKITLQDLPAPHGLIYFAESQHFTPLRADPEAGFIFPVTGDGIPLNGITWHTTKDDLYVISLAERDIALSGFLKEYPTQQDVYTYNRRIQPPLGLSFQAERCQLNQVFDANAPLLKMVATFSLLMRQNGLSESEIVEAPRTAQKRIRRAGHNLDPVRVVRVGQKHKRNAPTTPNEEFEYSHRWVVQGHWRNQPYGENMELRRPKWIAPYIKGPEDKPLVVRETVNLWK